MQCSKERRYSITSVARSKIDVGTSSRAPWRSRSSHESDVVPQPSECDDEAIACGD